MVPWGKMVLAQASDILKIYICFCLPSIKGLADLNCK